MTVESHLAELQRRHIQIDSKIADEEKRPSSDDLEIAALKRKKLSLKDQIERLSREVSDSAIN